MRHVEGDGMGIIYRSQAQIHARAARPLLSSHNAAAAHTVVSPTSTYNRP